MNLPENYILFAARSTFERVLLSIAAVLQVYYWLAPSVETGIQLGWWQVLIPIATTLLSGYFGNKAADKAGKRTSTEQMMEKLLYEGAQGQNEFGKFLMDLSRDPLVSSRNFLNAAANGDQETLMQLLGPELRNLSDGARQSLQTMAQLMPRGGMSADTMGSIPFQTQAQQGQLMAGTQANAKRDLMGFGTNLANLGGNFVSGASRNAGNVLDYEGGRRRDAFNQGAAAGESFYNMFSNVVGGFQDYYAGKRAGSGGKGTVPSAQSFYGGSSLEALERKNYGAM